MTTLFVAWQAPGASRAWFPIGRLDVENKHYAFRYTQGALDAEMKSGFSPLISFPKFGETYESGDLFPLFQNRVLDPSRKDFEEYIGWLGLNKTNSDPIEILGLTGGERQTDSLEVFTRIVKREDQSFSCRFFLHGLRHVLEAARESAYLLKPDAALQIAVELNNPTGLAIQLQTHDHHMIGWSPRYLVPDLIAAINSNTKVSAKVVQVNEYGAPLARRILIELSGNLPADYVPMSSPEFRVLSA